MNRDYIRYATTRKLPEAIEIKRINIQNEILRVTGMRVKVSKLQVQRYLAEELKQPKIKFDIAMWNRVITSK